MRYFSIIFSCYAASLVIASTDFEDNHVNTDLLQARNEVNHSPFFICPRSPVESPSKSDKGQSRGSTPARGGSPFHVESSPPARGESPSRTESSPQPDGGKERNRASRRRQSTPQSRGTPPQQPQDRPPRSRSKSLSPNIEQPQGTPQSQGTPQPQGTPPSYGGEMTPTSSNRAQAQGFQTGGRGRGYGRGQNHGYYPNHAGPGRFQVAPPFHRGPYQLHPGNQYEPYGRHEHPVHAPIPAYRGQHAVSNLPAHNSPGPNVPNTRVETQADGPGRIHAHGGEGQRANMYIGNDERGSKRAEHHQVSYGGGEALQGGRVVTQVTGQKVHSRVEPGIGGMAQIRYQTPGGLAASTFFHPARGELGVSSRNGSPVTLQTISEGPSEIYASARNSPPRNPPR